MSRYENIINNTAIAISSCDNYSDVWPAFFSSFEKYWPDCPFPIYLGSNYKQWTNNKIFSITVGTDVSWGANLNKLITKIDKKYIILFLDDFLLHKSVDNDQIFKLIEYAQKEEIDCFRLRPSPEPSKRVLSIDNIDIGVILPGEAYRISTQVSIWKVKFLKSICTNNMSAWDFELQGSKNINSMECKIFGVYKWAIHYQHCIEKGKWLESGVALAKQNGFTPDLSLRPILDEEERKKPLWKKILLNVYGIIPSVIKRGIRRILFPPENYQT